MDIRQQFTDLFGGECEAVCFAPGRVNLIGEHTDYNGGHVFPCALSMGIACAARKRNDRSLRLYSLNFPDGGIVGASLDDLTPVGGWIDYVKAVIAAFISRGYPVDRGMDMVFSGNLPDGAGLSSSAAMEVLTGTVLRELFGFDIAPREIALIGQYAENRFIGVNCGIMDQFASALGREGYAILLDTDTLEYAFAPIPSEKAAIVLIDSGVKHSLASSAYNDRRRECETALRQLSGVTRISSLCALSPEEWEKYSDAVTDPTVKKRAHHAVTENARVMEAVEALNAGDLVRFGRLMTASHISLRDDYEVSCEELDLLVDAALKIDGVYGARMTGGGFGGCTVNLVSRDRADDFVRKMTDFYEKSFGRTARILTVEAGSGAGKI